MRQGFKYLTKAVLAGKFIVMDSWSLESPIHGVCDSKIYAPSKYLFGNLSYLIKTITDLVL